MRKLKKLIGPLTMLGAVLLWSVNALAAPPKGIRGKVTVVNDEANPVPVTIQNAGQEEAIEVSTALPVLYRVRRTAFGSGADSTKTVSVTERVILYDVSAQTGTIHQLAGCAVSVGRREGGMGGPFTEFFHTIHFEKDVVALRDGQTTQQRLGRGVVIEPGDDILIISAAVTNPDIPVAGPDAFCSTTVQLFGEVLPWY